MGSRHLTYNAITQQYITTLRDEPKQDDVFVWDENFGLQKQPPLQVLLPHGMSRPVTPLPGPMFDPGLMAPTEDVESLAAKFPLIERARAALRKHEGVEINHLNAVEHAVFNQAVACLRICSDALTSVANKMHEQRTAQKKFNDAYTMLTELIEQCPTPFA